MAGSQSDVTATVESQEPLDDIFLNIQSATILVKNIWHNHDIAPTGAISRI